MPGLEVEKSEQTSKIKRRRKPSKPFSLFGSQTSEKYSQSLKSVITEKANIGYNDEEVIHHRNSPFFGCLC